MSSAVVEQAPAKKSETTRSPERLIVLRCYSYQQGNQDFTAECIDLDIIVRAKSLDEAISSLNCAVKGYLQVVFETQEWQLLRRPSPITHRIRYRILCLMAAIVRNRSFRLFDCTPQLCGI